VVKLKTTESPRQLKRFELLSRESQRHNLALTVLYVPNSLDSGSKKPLDFPVWAGASIDPRAEFGDRGDAQDGGVAWADVDPSLERRRDNLKGLKDFYLRANDRI